MDSGRGSGRYADRNRLWAGSGCLQSGSREKSLCIEGQTEGLPIYGSDALPRELDVTDRISFHSTDEDPTLWARRIVNDIERFPFSERSTYAQKMRDAGFDRETCFASIAAAYGRVISR